MSETPTGFDPRAHRMVAEQRWYDDFQIGERFPLPWLARMPRMVALIAGWRVSHR